MQDYDFELDSGLRRGAGHATSVACMVGLYFHGILSLLQFQVLLSVVAMVWVGCARMARNRRFVLLQRVSIELLLCRSVDLQVYKFTYYGTRRH